MERFFRIVTQRTTLKLSTDLSQDEMRQAIAKAVGRSVEEIADFDQASALAEIRKQSNRVNEIIKGHKLLFDSNPKITKDKYEELHDIGKFILATGDVFTIQVPEVPADFPDFILAQKHYKIGIEHTRLMSEEMKAVVKTAKYYIEKANQLLADELGYLSKTVNIFIDFNREVINGLSFNTKGFSSKEREEIPKIIAEYIKSALTGGNIPKPSFIIQVEITSNNDSRIDLELAERYFTQEDFAKLLINRIDKKETRADNYRSVNDFNELWLLIVIDDVSSFSGFDIETAIVPIIAKSNFDSIFIFEKFGCRIFRIYNR
jgi:hypothetical protein